MGERYNSADKKVLETLALLEIGATDEIPDPSIVAKAEIIEVYRDEFKVKVVTVGATYRNEEILFMDRRTLGVVRKGQ